MQALVDRLRAWDGSIAGADALRAALALEPAPRGRPAPGERGLAKLRSLEEPGATAAYVRWLCEHPEEQLVVAPLLGDPRFGPWPWDDPFGLEDDTALGVLELLGSHRIAVDPAIRLFLRVFLRVRPRAQHEPVGEHRHGDAHRLRQVLVNLVGNAVKFTDGGTVEVEVTEPADGLLQFTVRDTGPGIPPDEQERLFEPFVQTDTAHARDGSPGGGERRRPPIGPKRLSAAAVASGTGGPVERL